MVRGGIIPVCKLQSFFRCTYLTIELMSLLVIAWTNEMIQSRAALFLCSTEHQSQPLV